MGRRRRPRRTSLPPWHLNVRRGVAGEVPSIQFRLGAADRLAAKERVSVLPDVPTLARARVWRATHRLFGRVRPARHAQAGRRLAQRANYDGVFGASRPATASTNQGAAMPLSPGRVTRSSLRWSRILWRVIRQGGASRSSKRRCLSLPGFGEGRARALADALLLRTMSALSPPFASTYTPPSRRSQAAQQPMHRSPSAEPACRRRTVPFELREQPRR